MPACDFDRSVAFCFLYKREKTKHIRVHFFGGSTVIHSHRKQNTLLLTATKNAKWLRSESRFCQSE